MAKSIEQKAVDAIVAAMGHKGFRHHEFSRLMVEAVDGVRHPAREFMDVVFSYITYLATFHMYRYYPFGSQEIAVIAGKVAPTFDEAMGVELDANGFHTV